MVFVAFLVTSFSGFDATAVKKLGKFVLLLMVIPVYLFFRHSSFPRAAFWYGLVLGACVAATVGVWEITFDIYKPGYDGRAKGATHPIIFGDLALLMGVMSLAGTQWFRSRARWQIILPILALCMGILASILSQARGGWVAIPVFVVILLWASRRHVSTWLQFTGVGVLLAVLLAGYLIPQTGMKNKIETTAENISAYLNSPVNDNRRATSIGSRFEMWQASWQIFLQHPIKGVGWGNYREHAQRLVDQGLRHPVAAGWPHPHNQFFSAMVSGGILGLLAVILLFVLPAVIFIRVMHAPDRSVEARRMALAGLLLMVLFAVFNLSESFLERSRTVAFFVFYLAILMAEVHRDRSLR